MTPVEVDETSFLDLLMLCSGIDGRHEARKEAAKQGIWIP